MFSPQKVLLEFILILTRQLHSRVSIWFELHDKLHHSMCITCMGSKVWLRWLAVIESQCEATCMVDLSTPQARGDTSPLTPTPLGHQGGTLVQLSSRFPLKSLTFLFFVDHSSGPQQLPLASSAACRSRTARFCSANFVCASSKSCWAASCISSRAF